MPYSYAAAVFGRGDPQLPAKATWYQDVTCSVSPINRVGASALLAKTVVAALSPSSLRCEEFQNFRLDLDYLVVAFIIFLRYI